MKKISVVILLYETNEEFFENFNKTLSIIIKHHISDIYCIDNSPKNFTYSGTFSTLTDRYYFDVRNDIYLRNQNRKNYKDQRSQNLKNHKNVQEI